MRSIVLGTLAVGLASPALAAECRSSEGQVMGTPVSVVRSATWNGLKQTLTLGRATVSGGTLDGETMPETTFACTRSGSDLQCEAKDRRRAKFAEVKGQSIEERWTLVSNGNEVLRISYECDARLVRPPDEFQPFAHEDRHVVLHAQLETARFCAGKNIAMPVSYEIVDAELKRLHQEQKVDAAKDFYEFAQKGKMLLDAVGQRLVRYPEQGCAALLAALPQ